MFKKVAIVLVVAIVAFLGFVATRPATYRVERSIEVTAPQAAVFGILSDLNRFDEYSPWAALDPNMKTTITGAPGEGQTYEWSGNDDVGSGKTVNQSVVAPSKIVQSLQFITPFESTATVGYDLATAGKRTKVTWWMDGNNDFMGKLFGLFMDVEGMVGADFDRGLGKLKKVAEAEAEKAAAAAEAAAAADPAADEAEEAADDDEAAATE